MAAIEVEGLSKHWNQTKAVDDISFQVHKGEVFGFLVLKEQFFEISEFEAGQSIGGREKVFLSPPGGSYSPVSIRGMGQGQLPGIQAYLVEKHSGDRCG